MSTLEFVPDGEGTLLRYTEQGAYFMEGDHAPMRLAGCESLFELLAGELGTH